MSRHAAEPEHELSEQAAQRCQDLRRGELCLVSCCMRSICLLSSISKS